jgi:putative transposase
MYFPSIVKKSIPENYAETSLLSDEAKQAFGEYDVEAAIATACKKRGFKDFSPQCVRIIPMNKGVKMEVVVRVANAYPEQSFLAKLVKSHGSALAEIKTNKARESWLLDYLHSLSSAKMPRIASMDLGVNNLVTVAYSAGYKAAVHDGGRFEDAIKVFTDKIAKRIALITPARAKELQGRKDALQKEGKRLDMPEYIELNTILKELYADSEYRTLVAKKERWVKDYLHKTSHALVQQALERKTDVIVIGRNKGWKTDANMGTVQNRRFCQTAHATLITLITYKAQQQGIAVVTVEESYTSKTSFVNGDVLESFDEKETAKDKGIEIPFNPKRVDDWRETKDICSPIKTELIAGKSYTPMSMVRLISSEKYSNASSTTWA